METKPLPCPFCGALPRVAYGKVTCVNVTCLVKPKTWNWFAKGYEIEAVKDWNKRG